MKKHKRKRLRLKPLAAPQRQARSDRREGSGLRWMGWFGGLALIVLIWYFVVPKPHRPPRRSSVISAPTNKAVATTHDRPASSGDVGAPALSVNRPGAVKNRETEGDADDMNNKGVRLLESGYPAEAIPIIQQAVARKPDDETFHFNLALAYTKSGDVTNAEHEYKEALRLLPDYPEAENNYGNLLVRAGRFDEAEDQLSAAVESMPQSAPFNNSLGVLRQRLKKTNEALLSFKKAVECDTNFAEAHFNLAQEYLSRHDREKAIVQFLEVLRIKPGFAPAEQALARITSAP